MSRQLVFAALLIVAAFVVLTAVTQAPQDSPPPPPAVADVVPSEPQIQRASEIQLSEPRIDSAPPSRVRADSKQESELSIDRERDLFGIVVCEKGEPVGGALVATYTYPYRRLGERFRLPYGRVERKEAGPSMVTDSKGRFRFPLTRGDNVELVVRSKEHGQKTEPLCVAGQKITVRLEPRRQVMVRVFDRDGYVVPDARVTLTARLHSRGPYSVHTKRRLGRTDHQGEYLFDFVSGNTGSVRVYHPLASTSASFGPTEYGVPDLGALQRFELVVSPDPGARRSTGYVIDALTRKPVAGAWVFDVGRRVDVTCDRMGQFECWTEVEELKASASGYAMSDAIQVQEGMAFELSRGVRVVGKVVDPAGAAIAECYVACKNLDRTDHHVAETNRYGGFEIGGFRPQCLYGLQVWEPGLGQEGRRLDPIIAVDGVIDVGTLVLQKAGVIRGRVLDEKGVPFARAPIRVSGSNYDVDDLMPAEREPELAPLGETSKQRRSRLLERRRARPPFSMQFETATDDLGRFCIADLSAGDYRVFVELLGRDPVNRVVAIDEPGQECEITIEMLRGRSLRVEVVGASATTARPWVRVRDAGASWSVRCNAYGVAEVHGLTGKEARLRVRTYEDGERKDHRSIQVTPTGQTLVIDLSESD